MRAVFGPFPFESFGRFGPGRYCGTVTRRSFAPRRPGEPLRVVRRVRERRCLVPPQATVIAVATFAVT
jgi:hypothetical protein